METLDLSKYSDEEIVLQLMKLDTYRMMTIIKAIGLTNERAMKRAKTIASNVKDSELEEIVKNIFEQE